MKFLTTFLKLLFLGAAITSASAEEAPYDLSKIRNDKEARSTVVSGRERKSLLQRYPDQESRKPVSEAFNSALKSFLKENSQRCDFALVKSLENEFQSGGLLAKPSQFKENLKVLRIGNDIDDIFFEILLSSKTDLDALRNLKLEKAPGPLKKFDPKIEERNNLPELYSNFKTFPDEKSLCSLQEFIFIQRNLRDIDGKTPKSTKKLMSQTNRRALELDLIDLDSFQRLEFLRKKSQLEKRYIFLRDYLNIIARAKNQLVPRGTTYAPIKIEDEDDFSSERVKRFSRLTRRKILYRKYDETQIILLARVLLKASQRMGTDVDTVSGKPYIVQEFKVTEENGVRTYVERIELDPQSQFNLARRLLRKDILDLQMMDLFNGLTVTYQDVVMAAFETGYLSMEDINLAVRYDDLWNPETSDFERVMGFVFKVSGYATFFLPTPFNVIGTLALGIVEGLVEQKNGADNDNPATFIE